jgi:hypothetical protein
MNSFERKIFMLCNSINIANIYFSSGQETIVVGTNNYRDTVWSNILTHNEKKYDIDLCYVDGVGTERKNIKGFQILTPETKQEIFWRPSVIKIRYFGFYIPFYYNDTYRKIYHVNVISD